MNGVFLDILRAYLYVLHHILEDKISLFLPRLDRAPGSEIPESATGKGLEKLKFFQMRSFRYNVK